MIVSFEPTNVGSFTGNTNKKSFGNRYNKYTRNVLRNRGLGVRIPPGVLGFDPRNTTVCDGCRFSILVIVFAGKPILYGFSPKEVCTCKNYKTVRPSIAKWASTPLFIITAAPVISDSTVHRSPRLPIPDSLRSYKRTLFFCRLAEKGRLPFAN